MLLWPAASLHKPLYPAHGPVGVPHLPWEWSVVQQAAFWGIFIFNMAPCSLQQEK